LTLFVVGTPIGNLEDMSPRAVRVLGEADLIAAEDTRAAERLLAHFGIARPRVMSFFEGNEQRRGDDLLERLAAGEKIVVISEAGMPGVSDPGQRLVAAAAAAGVRVEVVPGPSATLAALVASGLPSARFTFLGFPPREEGARQELFAQLAGERATLIFFEAPPRVGATLADLAATLGGERRACLSRELTKIHEEHVRAPLGELAARYAEEPPRGEVTLVVAGAAGKYQEIDIEKEISNRISQGQSAKEIAAALALQTGKPRRHIYQLALALKR